MRKFLAALLAVMMLVGVMAALPVFAADEPRASKFDGTTTEATIDLVITEILVNSSTGNPELDQVVDEGDAAANVYARDAFDYIEIYNRGTTVVNLYDYAIVSAVAKDFDWTNKLSETTGKFTGKVVLKEGNVLTGDDVPADAASGSSFTSCYNPPRTNADLLPGEFAVIWFYNKDTDRLATKLQEAIGPAASGDPFTKFLQHYPEMPADTKVFAACGKTGTLANGQTAATFGLASNYTYALVEKDLDINQKVIDNPWSKDNTNGTPSLTAQGQKILCMADYRTGTAVGMVTAAGDDMAANYVPAACAPDLYNAIQMASMTDAEKAEYVAAKDYVESKFTNTYLGTAMVLFNEDPTPGRMPAWQWMYVDPVGATWEVDGEDYAHGLQTLEAAAQANADTYEATMKALVSDWATNTAIKNTDGKLNIADANTDNVTDWVAACTTAFLNANVAAVTGDGNKTEVKTEYNFIDRDVIAARNEKKNTTTPEEKGLPVWALILIIVGGVLLVGGAAVVVIIILKKKNKPVAADDVAAEGEVQVIDETDAADAPVEEAPVEEAAAEEAPAEEDKE